MIPRAKTERRSKAPPENMSMKLKSVPLAWAKKADRARGVDSRRGDVHPDAVNGQEQKGRKTLRFSSGIFGMFWNPWNKLYITPLFLRPPQSYSSRKAEMMRPNRDRLVRGSLPLEL